jgi:hypothetical protein
MSGEACRLFSAPKRALMFRVFLLTVRARMQKNSEQLFNFKDCLEKIKPAFPCRLKQVHCTEPEFLFAIRATIKSII